MMTIYFVHFSISESSPPQENDFPVAMETHAAKVPLHASLNSHVLKITEPHTSGGINLPDTRYVCATHTHTHSTHTHTLPFKSLGSLRNILVFDRKAHVLSFKITSN